MLPQVTVVIPVWDAYVAELPEAVKSVRNQEAPAELIVVDNASRVPLPPISSAQIVRLEDRRSRGAARNAALARLRTPYVVFLDADDELLPGALSALLEGIGADIGSSAYVLSIIDGTTGRRHRSPRRLARALSAFPTLFAFTNAVWSLLPTQGAAIMRADDVRACGGYGYSDYGEDWVLAVSLAFRGRIRFDRRSALRYRRRDDSPSSGSVPAHSLLENARRVRARVREDPAIPGWTRSALPLIAVAQWAAARVAHPMYKTLRASLAAGVSRADRLAPRSRAPGRSRDRAPESR